MTIWNNNMDEAPKGRIKKNTDAGGRKQPDTFVPARILTWKAGDAWRVSWWLPPGVEGAGKNGRWNFYTEDHPPTHWVLVEDPVQITSNGGLIE